MKYVELVKVEAFSENHYIKKGDEELLYFKHDQELGIKWPDGKQTIETVEFYVTSPEDLSSKMIKCQLQPCFKTKVNGLEVRVTDFERLQFKEDDLITRKDHYNQLVNK